jgi:hypothetical protein
MVKAHLSKTLEPNGGVTGQQIAMRVSPCKARLVNNKDRVPRFDETCTPIDKHSATEKAGARKVPRL